jgi:hypothetical protein
MRAAAVEIFPILGETAAAVEPCDRAFDDPALGYVSAFTNCRGDEDIDAKRSRPSIGKPVMGHARKERVLLFGTDQRITSGPAAKRPHSKAEYMTAPERFADS